MTKKPTTSKKRGAKPGVVYRKLPKNREKKYPGQEPSYKLMPGEKPDPEDVLMDYVEPDAPPITQQYPAPKKNPEFRRRWNRLIVDVTARENFKIGHLYQLEVLCDLYVEYDLLAKFLRMNGYTYEAHGRQGKVVRPFPQVPQMNRVKAEIRSYSKMLGLLLVKDTSSESGGEGDKWT